MNNAARRARQTVGNNRPGRQAPTAADLEQIQLPLLRRNGNNEDTTEPLPVYNPVHLPSYKSKSEEILVANASARPRNGVVEPSAEGSTSLDSSDAVPRAELTALMADVDETDITSLHDGH
jgi:hypothetical protein